LYKKIKIFFIFFFLNIVYNNKVIKSYSGGDTMSSDNSLLNEIAENYPKFTKAEKKIADFILANPQKALNVSITDMAEMCGIGYTSVFRFCRTLHLKGYQDFRVALAISTNNREILDTQTVMENLQSNDLNELIDAVYQTYQSTLSTTIHTVDAISVQTAVDLLVKSSFIHFFGVGGSGVTAMEAQNLFLRINPNVIFHPDSHEQLIEAALLDTNCSALIFSNSGITKDCIEIAKLARKNNAKVIFVTRFAKTPAKEYADVVLLSGAIEAPLQGGSIAGKVSQLFIVDLLYTEYFRRKGERAVANKQVTSISVAEKML
jgi:DNA-binding MurR/RpiR family transcriptional regulator